MPKKWYQSKTVWFNLALIVLDALNQIVQLVPATPGVVSAIGVVGVALRAITKEAVSK